MFKALIGVCSATFNFYTAPFESALMAENLVDDKIAVLRGYLPEGEYQLQNGESFSVKYLQKPRAVVFESAGKTLYLRVHKPFMFTWDKAITITKFDITFDQRARDLLVHWMRGSEHVQIRMMVSQKDNKPFWIWAERQPHDELVFTGLFQDHENAMASNASL